MRVRIGRSLATAGLASAGLAAPIATLAAVSGPLAAALPVAVVSWLALAAYVFEAPRLWPELSRLHARTAMMIGTLSAVVSLAVGRFLLYVIAVSKDLCGPHTLPAWIGGAVAYIAFGAFVLQSGRFAAGRWSSAVLLGWGVVIGLLFVLPGTHGYCET